VSAAVLFYASRIVASDDGRTYQARERRFLSFKAGRAFRRLSTLAAARDSWVEWAQRRDLQAPRAAPVSGRGSTA
jgi:hypothetical protein